MICFQADIISDMNRKEASKCMLLLTEKLGVHFMFSYHANVVWPTDQVPNMTCCDKKYGMWTMRIVDGKYSLASLKFPPEDMIPTDNEFAGNAYSSWYCTDENVSTGKGFRVKSREGDCAAKLVSKLSGRTFTSASKRVSIPTFSSYEELKLKLNTCHG